MPSTFPTTRSPRPLDDEEPRNSAVDLGEATGSEQLPGRDGVDRDERRLLSSVADIAETVRSHTERSEAQGHLAVEAVEALRSRDLWRLRLCRELGGLELPVTSQIRVLAALAAEDTSAAWCTMVANSSVAVLGATMPDAAIARIFADGVPACSIVAAPSGRATPTADGYTLTGTWRLASSIHHADWIHATTHVEGDPSRPMAVALPARDVQVLDSWHVVGLAATGSNDFSLTDHPLPAALAGPVGATADQRRGTRRYDHVDLEGLESYEHLAFALGVGHRALDELARTLAQPGRRYTADREVVQNELGRALTTLQAVEAAAQTVWGRVDAAACGDLEAWPPHDRHLPRALAVWATEQALACVQLAFRRAPGVALHRPNILEKLLRDMNVAATHVMVGDTAFSALAHHLVESGAAATRGGGQHRAN